jgi:hypothetical protein
VPARDRLIVATAVYTGLGNLSCPGLICDDIDFAAGVVHVRAQLSRAYHGALPRRVAPKAAASVPDIALVTRDSVAALVRVPELVDSMHALSRFLLVACHGSSDHDHGGRSAGEGLLHKRAR